MLQHSKTFKTENEFFEAIRNGNISPIAYFRQDGGDEILYTQEFVDKLEKRIEELEKINNDLSRAIILNVGGRK